MEELTKAEIEAINKIDKHLFSAPYELMKQDFKAMPLCNPATLRTVISRSAATPGGLLVRRLINDGNGKKVTIDVGSFAQLIKLSALASATTEGTGMQVRLKNRTARTTVMAVFKVFGGELENAAQKIAENMEEGQSIVLRPNPETRKTDVFLFSWKELREKIDTPEFILKNFGREGVAKLSSLLS
jgi:hypothetical protein